MLQKYIRNLAIVFASAVMLVVLFLYADLSAARAYDFNMVSINVVPAESQLSDARAEQIANLLKTVLHDSVVMEDSSFVQHLDNSVSMVAHRDGKVVNRYDLYIQSVAKKIGYLYDGLSNKWLKLSAERFVELGKLEELSTYFLNSEIPQLFIVNSLKSSASGIVKSGAWSYVNPDGYYIDALVKPSQGEIMELSVDDNYFACTKTPDLLIVTVTDEDNNIVLDHHVMQGAETLNCFQDGKVYYISAEATWNSSIDKDYFGHIIYEFTVGIKS